MIPRARSKQGARASRTSSTSRSSATGGKRTRSANRTVTWRRSATGSWDGVVAVRASTGKAPAAPRTDPHSLQNFASGSVGEPQVGQAAMRRVPQSLQNLAPTGFSLRQTGQATRDSNTGDGEDISLAERARTDERPR